MNNLNKRNLNHIELVTEKNNDKYFIIDNNSNKTTIYIGDKKNKNKQCVKSKKRRKFKNKTIKGGNKKNKIIKGGDLKDNYITNKLENLIVHDDEADKLDVIKINEHLSNKKISIIKGYKHQDNGSIAYLCKDDNNAFFFVQGEKTIELSV